MAVFFARLNDVDHFNRKALSIDIGLNLPALQVIRVLDRGAVNYSYPAMPRIDNGLGFISLTLAG